MLEFKIKGQTLIRLDNFDVVADSKKYLKAHFNFIESDFSGTITAIFTSKSIGIPYTRTIVDDMCEVPYEVLKSREFKISLFCYIDDVRITTDIVTIKVKKSGYIEGETPREPPTDVYERILSDAAETKKIAQSIRTDADNGLFNGKDADQVIIDEAFDKTSNHPISNSVVANAFETRDETISGLSENIMNHESSLSKMGDSISELKNGKTDSSVFKDFQKTTVLNIEQLQSKTEQRFSDQHKAIESNKVCIDGVNNTLFNGDKSFKGFIFCDTNEKAYSYLSDSGSERSRLQDGDFQIIFVPKPVTIADEVLVTNKIIVKNPSDENSYVTIYVKGIGNSKGYIYYTYSEERGNYVDLTIEIPISEALYGDGSSNYRIRLETLGFDGISDMVTDFDKSQSKGEKGDVLMLDGSSESKIYNVGLNNIQVINWGFSIYLIRDIHFEHWEYVFPKIQWKSVANNNEFSPIDIQNNSHVGNTTLQKQGIYYLTKNEVVPIAENIK